MYYITNTFLYDICVIVIVVVCLLVCFVVVVVVVIAAVVTIQKSKTNAKFSSCFCFLLLFFFQTVRMWARIYVCECAWVCMRVCLCLCVWVWKCVFVFRSLRDLQHGPRHIWLGRRGGNLRQLDVNGHASVVECGRLQDNASRAHDHGYCEYPKEETIQYHGNIFPVLFDLLTKSI